MKFKDCNFHANNKHENSKEENVTVVLKTYNFLVQNIILLQTQQRFKKD